MSGSIADSSSLPPLEGASDWTLPRWQTYASHGAAALIAILFLVSGIWKITDPLGWTTKIEQFKVPYSVSLPFTILLAIGETWGAAMILVPRFRRWGAWLISLLLIGFMVYMGIHYNEFKSMDCSCFPMLKRAIGPGFFISDFAMLVLAGIAGWWARPSTNLRGAAVVLGSVAVFAGVCYGVAVAREERDGGSGQHQGGWPAVLAPTRAYLFVFLRSGMHALRRCGAQDGEDEVGPDESGGDPNAAEAVRRGVPDRHRVEGGDLPRTRGFEEDLPVRFHSLWSDPGKRSEKAGIARFDDSEPAETLRKFEMIVE